MCGHIIVKVVVLPRAKLSSVIPTNALFNRHFVIGVGQIKRLAVNYRKLKFNAHYLAETSSLIQNHSTPLFLYSWAANRPINTSDDLPRSFNVQVRSEITSTFLDSFLFFLGTLFIL